MDLADAAATFVRGMRRCDDLEQVHGQSGGQNRGRRWREVSINPAIVVLAVAAWQAAVQDMTLVCVESARPEEGSCLSLTTYNLLAGNIKGAIGRFSTPNAQNSRKILQSAGFDPHPLWTWRVGGRGSHARNPSDVEEELDEWLKIRHAVAHGQPRLPDSRVLKSRPSAGSTAEPSLRLGDARRCVAFVRRLTKATGDGLADHLGVAKTTWITDPTPRPGTQPPRQTASGVTGADSPSRSR